MALNFVKNIGQGGLGIVNLYRDDTTGEEYAVKQMLRNWPEDERRRFRREAEETAKLEHPHIIKVLNYNVDSEPLWYLMPYFQDGSLRDKLEAMKATGKVFPDKCHLSPDTVPEVFTQTIPEVFTQSVPPDLTKAG